MKVKSALYSAAVLLAGATVLVGCGPDTDPSAKAPASTPPPSASVSSSPVHSARPTPPQRPSPTPSTHAPSVPRSSATPTGGANGGAGGGEATSDSYAFRHLCTSGQLAVKAVHRAGAPTQRIIEVRNLGTRSCGLSYYPRVVLYNGDSATGDPSVVPAVPDGLGGAPTYPLYAGRTAYAVVDLDPSGDTKHAVALINTMNVLPEATHMSSRYTRQYRLGAGDHVLDPRLGLYERTLAAAVHSVDSVGPAA